MKINDFLKSKKNLFLLHTLGNFIILYLFVLARSSLTTIILTLLVLNITFIINIIIFYAYFWKIINNLEKTEKSLNEKFLIKNVQKNLGYEEGLIFQVIENISYHQYNQLRQIELELINEKETKILWAHDIKQPLAILSGDNITNFERKKAVNVINNKLDYLLKCEKIENMGEDLMYQKVFLNTEIKNVLKNISFQLIELDAKIKIDIDEEDCVFTDKFWFQFMLEQILSNSIKYRSNKQLFIQIGVTKTKEDTIVTISDNGIGIENHDLKNVFDKGYRGTNAKVNEYSSGYGLHYVKTCASKLNTNVIIKNNNSGEGISVDLVFKNKRK